MSGQTNSPAPGAHLRVRRCLYWHHGIAVNDGCVVEFGGGSLLRKQATSIQTVPYESFAEADRVETVAHPQRFLGSLGMGLPAALPPNEIVARALWLTDHRPSGRYHLIGGNCEHVTNWCVTGGYFESLQVRRSFFLRSVVSAAAMLTWRWLPARWRAASVALSLSTLVTVIDYQRVPYRRWSDLLKQYPASCGVDG